MLTAVDRRVLLVTYKLHAAKIMAALLMHPGKVILSGRQTGKTTQLAMYVEEHHPEGSIIFCPNDDMAKRFRDYLTESNFKNSIIVWGQMNPPFFPGIDQPIYADEFFMIPGSMRKAIVSDRRFKGAVSSVSSLAITDEEKNLCILC